MGVLMVLAAAAATIAVPGRGAATPSIAAHGSMVAVAFSATDAKGATDVFVAVSQDGGRRFDAPVRVNDVAGAVDVGGEQPPRIEIVGAGSDRGARPAQAAAAHVVVVWTMKTAQGTRLMQSRSVDGGRSFARAVVVPGSDAPGNRGWESIEGPLVLWLDHRDLARDSAESTTHVHGGGESMAERSKLYIGSLDASVPPHAITGGVCYCCKTAIAVDGANVYAAWRHVFPGSVRDIAFALSRDGGRSFAPPVRVSDDRWVLQGCPENGPALAVDARARVHVVWPTLTNDARASDGNLALFYARTTDGAHFTERRRVGTEGTPRHPQIVAAADGSLVVAWDESGGGPRRALLSRVAFDGAGEPTFTRERLGDGVYPALAVGDVPIVAWVAPDGIAVRRIAHR